MVVLVKYLIHFIILALNLQSDEQRQLITVAMFESSKGSRACACYYNVVDKTKDLNLTLKRQRLAATLSLARSSNVSSLATESEAKSVVLSGKMQFFRKITLHNIIKKHNKQTEP